VRAGRLLFPALRWHPDHGFTPAARTIELALELGAGGFIVFGGPAGDVAALTAELRGRSRSPLLIAADLERGAGQQFPGAVSLPPAAAFGELGDLDATRRAGELTAREARALGVDWIYAPVADLDAEPANPIVGTRAWGSQPGLVAAHVGAWIAGCRSAGALACAKHFPGHGRTVTDSHLGLPVVDASPDVLEADLLPFRVAVERGVDSVMTAHVAYPALDPSGRAATLSRRIVTGLLRERLGFGGLVVTDALIMAGALGADADEGQAAVSALAAGCDALLYPTDLELVAAALDAARGRALPDARIAQAVSRVDGAARAVRRSAAPGHGRPAAIAPSPGGEWGRAQDREWALTTATRTLRLVRGEPAFLTQTVELITVDDDLGGPFPPGPRTLFPAALAAAGIEVRESETPDRARAAVVALYADIRGWKGRPHISAAGRERVRQVLAARPDATVVLFGHPRLGAQVPGSAVLAAWGGDPVMQEAAARWLAARAR
jgi:beta-glucosidase-like glycosyl hydrolase